MQLPISIGTILQNRYHIINILGQGGFGRTYLAEDQGRFRELCALKELIPAQAGSYAIEKSRELFQREATILYQIQHPQIPQFRATFEQDQRLFLVQDYVEGKTYRNLLEERKQQGYAFSEPEVLLWLQQMLPVLAHIHAKGIIHRDISPDNVICRDRDRLPVLIDFGVVKELATRIQSGETATQATSVGKLGYAPNEQMQTGRAYPSSDLYALAVTAVVLLTGREPQELFDDTTGTWYWHRWIAVNPTLTAVLNRMLNARPGDRFQSAGEVMQALQSPVPPSSPGAAVGPDPSQMATMAVGRRPEPGYSPTPANGTDPYVPTPRVRTIWDDPLAVTSLGAGLALIAGIASWAIVSALVNPPTPTPAPTQTVVVSPALSPSPSPTPTSSPSPSPVAFSKRLELATGSEQTLSASLRSNQTIDYLIAGRQGQQLTAAIDGEGILLTLLSPNGDPVDDAARRVTRWQGSLPFTGEFALRLSPIKGIAKSDYKLTLLLKDPPAPTPAPSPVPSPVSPVVNAEPVTFPAGTTQTQITGQANPTTIRRYLVNVQRGQILNVEILQGTVTLDIRTPDGQLIADASKILSWQSQVTSDGNYQIDVVADRDTDFTLTLGVTNSQ